MITCLNRFLGFCPKCQEDYDTNKHPNNFDCPRFHLIYISVVTIGGDNAMLSGGVESDQ
jgi:hypothetical protein